MTESYMIKLREQLDNHVYNDDLLGDLIELDDRHLFELPTGDSSFSQEIDHHIDEASKHVRKAMELRRAELNLEFVEKYIELSSTND